MKFLFSAILLVFSAGIAAAQSMHAEIAEYGIFAKPAKQFITEVPTPTSPDGLREVYSGPIVHAATATTIPAAMGTNFGFTYRISGEASGARIPVHYVITYPAPGIRNDKGQLTERTEWDASAFSDAANFLDYGFDYDWELVSGTWTMQVWSEGQELIEIKFEVVKLVG